MCLPSNKLKCKWAREKIHSSKVRFNGMPAGLIKPSLRCAHTEKWMLAFTRLRLTCASKLPCCFCERVTASQLAGHLVVSPVRIRQVFESFSNQGTWMVWYHSFMAYSAWWRYGLGKSLECDPLGLEDIVSGYLQTATSSPPPPLTSLSAQLHPPLWAGWGQEGYLCCYQG